MIACIVPSRGRPGNIVELIEAWRVTSTEVESRLVVCVDLDDPKLDEYEAIKRPDFMHLIRGERLRLGGTLNAVAPSYAASIAPGGYTAIGFMGDDHRPRTVGWDSRIDAQLDKRDLGIVYGNDLIHGPGLPTSVFMDKRIVRTLGWMVYPGMIHLFFDNLWRKLGEELGTLTYLDDVVIEHCHPIAGKAEWDDGYAEVNLGEVWDHDQLLYVEWINNHMAADVARLKASV